VMVQIAQALHDVHCDAPEEDHHMHRSPQETTQH
jgi:hypothetical protein